MAINVPSAPSMFESIREWERYVSRLEALSPSNELARAAVNFSLDMARELIETKKHEARSSRSQLDDVENANVRSGSWTATHRMG